MKYAPLGLVFYHHRIHFVIKLILSPLWSHLRRAFFNLETEAHGGFYIMSEKIFVFDTTLRDGEQAAGTRLEPEEKLKIALQLARLGVNVIEAGFPCSSPKDFEAVKLIAEEVEGPIICGLTRALTNDIDICGKALNKASHSRIHTGLGVSDIHIAGKFIAAKYGKTLGEKKAKTLQMAVEAVKCAKSYTNDVEFYAEDAGRSDRDYLFEVLQAVIEAGATVVNIPDTTGYTVPEQFGSLIRDIRSHVPNIKNAIISVHCHDDLGMAVANTVAGIVNGARQVEGTINGIGERAGNAALEEVVMALRTRQDFFKVHTEIETQEFYRTSRMVAESLGITIPPNKAIIGDNAFSHSSGIHVDGVLKGRETYEIMKPEDIGFPQSRVVLTARTGRHGVRHRLEMLGYVFPPDKLEQLYQRFLKVADKKQEVFDEDLIAIMHDEIHSIPKTFELDYLCTISESGKSSRATVRLSIGKKVTEKIAYGDGPVDATYKAISSVVNMSPRLSKYEIQAATSGTEAMGKVRVHLKKKKIRVIGNGASTDVIEASAKAYIDGLNKLVAITKEIQ
jgi:2-isopropylmalate synthase